MDKNRLLLPINLILGILAISTASIFIRFSQAEGAPSLVIAPLRLTLATLLLTPLTLSRHSKDLKALSKVELIYGLIAGIFLALHFSTWITSLEYTTVASSALLVSTSPLWVALLSPLILNEKITTPALFGLITAIIGGTIIGLSDACQISNGIHCASLSNAMQGKGMWGNFLALCGAWAMTGYLMIGRKMQKSISLVPYVFMVYGMSAIVLIVILIISGNTILGYKPTTYAWIFLLAAVPQLIGHTSLNWALRHMPATMVSAVTLAEPVGSAILAFLLLNENPQTSVLGGGILILAGIYLTSRTSA